MNILIAPALGVFGLIVAFIVFSLVMRYSDGTDQVKKIGDEIHKGHGICDELCGTMPATDTIVALSTPAGESAIAVIRLSGPACSALSAQICD